MRHPFAIATLGLLFTAAIHAAPADVKTLAQFDLGFAKCEQRFPDMKGHRDEAYMALWKLQADDRVRGELATLRKGAKYQRERQSALKAMPKDSPELETKVRQQCQATWAEKLSNVPPKK